MMTPMPDAPETAAPSLADFSRSCLRVGLLGFGGPAGQIALMQAEFVDRHRWIDNQRFQHALGFCTLLPGPEAQQLATYIGWLLHGVRGGVIAGALFVLPGALVVFGLSWLYAAFGTNVLMAGLFLGIKAAVVALVVEALVKIAKRTLTARAAWMIAAAAFLALYLFDLPYPAVIAAAALAGLLVAPATVGATATSGDGAQSSQSRGTAIGAFKAALVWTAVWLAPLGLAAWLLGPDDLVTQVGALFARLSVITFGGAYATLAYLQQEAVDAQGWLSASQMIAGFGLAETTPGPLVLVNQFVGFMAGWNAGGANPLGLAALTAAMASWQTFAPSWVWIFAGAPFAERLATSRWIRGALTGILAAVLGVIASLSLWFAGHVLFLGDPAEVVIATGIQLAVPDMTRPDLVACAIALGAAVALLRFKTPILLVVAGAGLAGLLAALL
jgi:chromate transporter